MKFLDSILDLFNKEKRIIRKVWSYIEKAERAREEGDEKEFRKYQNKAHQLYNSYDVGDVGTLKGIYSLQNSPKKKAR